jgi:hypothetical protein
VGTNCNAHLFLFLQQGVKDGRVQFSIAGQQGPNSYRFGYDTGKGYVKQTDGSLTCKFEINIYHLLFVVDPTVLSASKNVTLLVSSTDATDSTIHLENSASSTTQHIPNMDSLSFKRI